MRMLQLLLIAAAIWTLTAAGVSIRLGQFMKDEQRLFGFKLPKRFQK